MLSNNPWPGGEPSQASNSGHLCAREARIPARLEPRNRRVQQSCNTISGRHCHVATELAMPESTLAMCPTTRLLTAGTPTTCQLLVAPPLHGAREGPEWRLKRAGIAGGGVPEPAGEHYRG